jgi:branched-chain amino acid transport system permease protein
MTLEGFFLQLVTGIGTGALLMLVCAGFTITFGLQRIINISHGALYMIGAYVAAELLQRGVPFSAVIVCAFAAGGVLGLVIQSTLLHRIRHADHLIQVLLTLGVSVIVSELLKLTYGSDARMLNVPAFLTGLVSVGGVVYPRYFLFVIACSTLLMLALWIVFSRARIGLMVQAVALDPEMAFGIGINVPRVQALTFGVGAGAAAVAGALAGPLFAVHPWMDLDIMPMVFAIVIFGGLGDVRGAVAGAVISGLILSFGTAAKSSTVATLVVFLLMAVTVAVRPQGLFGTAELRR